jgi:hypothetical protein
MARDYVIENFRLQLETRRHNATVLVKAFSIALFIFSLSSFSNKLNPYSFFFISAVIQFI